MKFGVITKITPESDSEGINYTSFFRLCEVKSIEKQTLYISIEYDNQSFTWTVDKRDFVPFETAKEYPTFLENTLVSLINSGGVVNYRITDEVENDDVIYHLIEICKTVIPNSEVLKTFISLYKRESVDLKEEFEKVMLAYFGDNFYKQGSYYTIHYPEITITNSNKRSHIIRDLFVNISVAYTNGSLNLAFYGARGSLTEAEILNNYLHSHLQRTSRFFDVVGFCLGTSCLKSFTKITNTDQLYLLGPALDDYVSWESLEGGPYTHMSSLKTSSNSAVRISEPTEALAILSLINLYDTPSKVSIRTSSMSVTYDISYIEGTYGCFTKNTKYEIHSLPALPEQLTSPEQVSFKENKSKSLILKRISDGSEKVFYAKTYKNTITETNLPEKAEVIRLSDGTSVHRYLTDILNHHFTKKLNEFIEYY